MSRETAREKLAELLAGVNLTRPQPNRPLTTSLMVYILAKIGQRAGLKNIGIHMIRRSFATHLYDHGVNIEIIQKLLGHVYLGSTLAYTRLSRIHMARAIDPATPFGRKPGSLKTRKEPLRTRPPHSEKQNESFHCGRTLFFSSGLCETQPARHKLYYPTWVSE